MSAARVGELDGVRAMAVASVLAFHLAPHRAWGGYLGVDLFFVLSGYLITTLLGAELRASGRIDLRAFWARRALRILPPMVAAILLACALEPIELSSIAAALLMYKNFLPPAHDTLGHLWSLAVEWHFYLAWPILFAAGARRGFLAAAVAAAFAVRVGLLVLDADPSWAWTITPARMDSIALGCLAAICPLPRAPLPLLLAALCLLLAIGAPVPAMLVGGFTLFAVVAALFVSGLAAAEPAHPIRRLFRSPVARYLGSRSYAIYLFHIPVFATMGGYGLAMALAKVAATLGLAELSYRTIERVARRARATLAQPGVAATAA
jgi:peptidoglycan/LPS O-acetylase OafA/YrhL